MNTERIWRFNFNMFTRPYEIFIDVHRKNFLVLEEFSDESSARILLSDKNNALYAYSDF